MDANIKWEQRDGNFNGEIKRKLKVKQWKEKKVTNGKQ